MARIWERLKSSADGKVGALLGPEAGLLGPEAGGDASSSVDSWLREDGFSGEADGDRRALATRSTDCPAMEADVFSRGGGLGHYWARVGRGPTDPSSVAPELRRAPRQLRQGLQQRFARH